MPEVIQNLVADARKSRFSSLPKLSHDDIINVWDAVSGFVETQMRSQKGVTIPGFGTFTFTMKRLDIGNNKFLLLQRPVFVLSEKFAQTHALQHAKHHTAGEIPVVSLNFTAVAIDSSFDRDVVESCVREVLMSLSRAISNQQSVEFLFRGIGVLYVKDMKVKMRFFKDFLNSMDGSGNLTKLMENLQEVISLSSVLEENSNDINGEDERPGTADSVMSTQTTLTAQGRPGTSTLTLPKLNGARDLLPPIHEDLPDSQDETKVSLPPALSVNRNRTDESNCDKVDLDRTSDIGQNDEQENKDNEKMKDIW